MRGNILDFAKGRLSSLLLLAILVVVRAADPGLVEDFRNRSFDFYQTLQPREAAGDSPVIVVDLDEKSLHELGQWPWPRTLIAELLANLFNGGVVAVAFDNIFPEPDRMSPAAIADHLVLLDDATRSALRTQPSNDAILADIFRQTRVVIGRAAITGTFGVAPADLPRTSIAEIGGSPAPYLPTFPQIVANIPELEAAAKGHGVITLAPESDGIVRRVPLLVVARGAVYPTLSIELLRVALAQQSLVVRTNAAGVDRIVIGRISVPTDRDGQVWVHFAPHDPGRFISAADVLRGDIDPARLRGKLVLIGTSAAGLLDLKATPIDGAMPGVEVHAQLLDNIISGAFLTRPNYALGMEVVATVLVSLLIIWLVPMLGPGGALAIGAVVDAALVGAAWLAYLNFQYLIDVTFAVATSTLLFAYLSFANYVREGVQKRQIRTAFSQYLSPALVEQLAAHPERLTLGGETRVMTFLFSDIFDFTATSERFSAEPAELTRLINRLLTPLTDAILERDGTIDKYMGDCVMAFWNAPIDDADHAAHACEAALAIRGRMDVLNAELRAEAGADADFRPLKVGIGINTGQCVVGNMGSLQRFDYSVLGDAVNLASRIEQQTRTYGVDIMIGESSAAAIPADRFALIEIDLIAVKGKTHAVRIYALVGFVAELDAADWAAVQDGQARFLAAYRARDWDGAAAALDSCRDLVLWPQALHGIFHGRIARYRETPPEDEWTGAYIAETK